MHRMKPFRTAIRTGCTTDDIRLGMLMLISHFYENRSSVTEVEKLDMPQSFGWLVGPYRYFPQ